MAKNNGDGGKASSLASNTIRLMGVGAVAGVITKTFVAPLERIKMLFQIQGQRQGVKYLKEAKYTSPLQAFRMILAEEGVRGLFKGNGANCTRIIPSYALKFAFNDTFKELVLRKGQNPKDLDVMQRLQAGGAAGIINVIGCCPLEVVRTRLTMSQGLGGPYKGMVQCCVGTVREEGFSALYKGISPALLTTVPYIAFQMTFYDLFKKAYPREPDGSTSIPWLLAAGASAGLCAQTLCYPGDTVRRQLQTNGIAGEQRLYTGTLDCIRQIFAREGVVGFYRGLAVNIVKCIPEAGIQFASYELIKSFVC